MLVTSNLLFLKQIEKKPRELPGLSLLEQGSERNSFIWNILDVSNLE
jgi:hypothetical protein